MGVDTPVGFRVAHMSPVGCPTKCEIRDSTAGKTLRNAVKRSAEPVQEFRGRKNVTSNTVCFSSPSLAACPEDLQQGWLVGRKQSWQVHQLINDKSKIRVVYFRFFFFDPRTVDLL